MNLCPMLVRYALLVSTTTVLSAAVSNGKHLRSSYQSMTHAVEKEVNQSSNALVVPSAARPVRIYFLFMGVDKISNLDVWTKFFKLAPVTQYRAFVHCKLPSCINQVAGSVLKPVPTIPSWYCADLVSPMNRLLASALADEPNSVNPDDKFAFVSDSTLPAKSFADMYDTLAVRKGSDFCAFPANEWADMPAPGGGAEIAIKYHQWIVLQREHAQRSTQLWTYGNQHTLMKKFGMNVHRYSWLDNNTFADHRNFGCLDEFWHMSVLFGPLTIKKYPSDPPQLLDFPHFTNGPLKVSKKAGWQGACDTFVLWDFLLNTVDGNNPFKKLHAALDGYSIPHDGNGARPGWWDKISEHGIKAMRDSQFLFVRKFVDKPLLQEGGDFAEKYSAIVFGKKHK